MSTTIALSAAASAQASAASAHAVAAKKVACTALIETFTGTHDVVVMQKYAECVQLLHPDDMDSDVKLFFKALIIISLLVAGVAGWLDRGYMGTPILTAFVAGICTFFGIAAVGGIIGFLVS